MVYSYWKGTLWICSSCWKLTNSICIKINQIWIDIPYMDHVGWWSPTIWQVHKSCRRGSTRENHQNPFSGIKFGRAPFTFWYHMGLWVSMDLNSIHKKIWLLFTECHPLNHCYEVICVGSLKVFHDLTQLFLRCRTWTQKRLQPGPCYTKIQSFNKKPFLMDSEKKDDLLGFLFQEHYSKTSSNDVIQTPGPSSLGAKWLPKGCQLTIPLGVYLAPRLEGAGSLTFFESR